MVAALALAEARGLPWREAARLSMAAGAANVSCQGTEPAPREAVEALTALGYSPTEATKAVRQVEIADGMSVEAVLKASLKFLAF